MIVNRWRVYCVTDTKYEYTWRDENEADPTTCPVNTGHTIDASLNRIIEVRNPDIVKVKEEDTPTGGHYAMDGICFDALASQTTTYTINYPFPINIVNIQFPLESSFSGDSLIVETAPDTVIGTITSDVSISDTVINVSQSVIDNIFVGMYVKLDDLVNLDNLGRVISVDKDNLTITVETATTFAFLTVTPTTVKVTLRYVNIHEFSSIDINLGVGNYKIGASYLPANTDTVCSYTNNGGSSKRVLGFIEYLY